MSAALGLLLAFALLNALAYRHAWAMMHYRAAAARTPAPEALSFSQKLSVLLRGVSLPRPSTVLPPTQLDPGCRSVSIAGAGGIRLGAWHCAAPGTGPLVILFHGYGGEKSGTLAEAKAFLELGASVLLVDFRGSGDSSAASTTLGFDEAEDVATAVRYARETLGATRIVLYGQSMGAAAVLRAVGPLGTPVEAVIVEAVFDRLLTTVNHRFEAMGLPAFPGARLLVFWGGWQAGFSGFTHNPADYATNVHCPLLFLHGSADPRARVQEGRRVYEAAAGKKRFREFPGVGHIPAAKLFPDEWREEVRQFLSAEVSLGKAAGSGPSVPSAPRWQR